MGNSGRRQKPEVASQNRQIFVKKYGNNNKDEMLAEK
jgi:hypothetical protein